MSRLKHYLDYFGLRSRPFSLVPDPGFLYWSPAHKRAWSMLEYGLMTHAPITLITGEVGTGKTTLLRHLLANTDNTMTVGLVSNAQGGRGELMEWALQALGLEIGIGESYVAQFDRLQRFLIEEYAAGRRVALGIDEAQNLSVEGLEELRMLTNINSGQDELMQLVLIGQPELRDVVRRPDMTQFAQRVAVTFHLTAMSAEEIRAYIRHRIELAGGRGDLFDDSAIALIYRATEGVPRLVNQLCELAMLYALGAESREISQAVVQSVLDDGIFLSGGAVQSPRLVLPEGTAAPEADKRVE